MPPEGLVWSWAISKSMV